MRHHGRILLFLLLIAATGKARDETVSTDLIALGRRARPAVMLLIMQDASGKTIGLATGFVVSPDGKLATNRHVTRDAVTIIAKDDKGRWFPVLGVLAEDDDEDAILLKINATNLPSLSLGSTRSVEVGKSVVIIGNPKGAEGTVTEGTVGGLNSLVGELQITAPIGPGSSGSPVIDREGRLVAMITSGSSKDATRHYGVPAEAIKGLVAANNPSLKPLSKLSSQHPSDIWQDPVCKEYLDASLERNHGIALDRARKVADSFPRSALAQCLVGNSLCRLDRYPEAIAAYQAAIKLKNDYAPAWEGIASAYGKQRKFTEAAEAFEQAIKISPDDAFVWLGLGVAQAMRGNHSEAAIAYQNVVKLDSNDVDAWLGLGLANERQGKHADAAAAYERASKLKPDDIETWSCLAWAQCKGGKFTEAASAFEYLVKVQPDDVESWEALAWTYCKQGKYADAISAYRRVLKAKPEDAEVWDSLGWAYRKAGELSDAAEAYGHVTKLRPNDASAWVELASVYSELGQRDKAQEAVSRLKVVDPRRAKEVIRRLQ